MRRIFASTALQLLRRFSGVPTIGIDPSALLLEPVEDIHVEHLENGFVQITWQFDADAVEVFAGTQPDNIDWNKAVGRITGDHNLLLDEFDATRRCYFALKMTGGSLDGQSLVVANRQVALEGAFNLRDIGGYRTLDGRYVRWGLVYRAGELTNLSSVALDALVNELHVKLICDLRNMAEIENAPERLPEFHTPQYLHVNLSQGDGLMRLARVVLTRGPEAIFQEMLGYYQRIVDTQATTIGDLLRSLLDSRNLPVLFHCTAGKDRTGIIIALLLTAFHVPEETIIADYSLSNLAFPKLLADMEKNERLREVGIPAESFAPVLVAQPDWLRATLDHLRAEYGTVENYLHVAAGLDEVTLERLRNTLLV